MVKRVFRRLLKSVNDMGRRRQVGISLSQVNDVMARRDFLIDILHKAREKLGRQPLHDIGNRQGKAMEDGLMVSLISFIVITPVRFKNDNVYNLS